MLCTGLTTVTCPATEVPESGELVFSNCPALTAIYVPAESVDAYKEAENWKFYADFIQAIP